MRQLDGPSKMPRVFAVLIGGLPLFWISIYDTGWPIATLLIYVGIILFFSALGAHLGQKAGQKAQELFRKQLKAYFEKVQSQQTKNPSVSSNHESTDPPPLS